MEKALEGIIGAVVIILVITNVVTGTDAGSLLLQTAGNVLAGVGGLYVLVRSFVNSKS
jgi:hypothetical protein